MFQLTFLFNRKIITLDICTHLKGKYLDFKGLRRIILQEKHDCSVEKCETQLDVVRRV